MTNYSEERLPTLCT